MSGPRALCRIIFAVPVFSCPERSLSAIIEFRLPCQFTFWQHIWHLLHRPMASNCRRQSICMRNLDDAFAASRRLACLIRKMRSSKRFCMMSLMAMGIARPGCKATSQLQNMSLHGLQHHAVSVYHAATYAAWQLLNMRCNQREIASS